MIVFLLLLVYSWIFFVSKFPESGLKIEADNKARKSKIFNKSISKSIHTRKLIKT